jgi:hypothetical protein
MDTLFIESVQDGVITLTGSNSAQEIVASKLGGKKSLFGRKWKCRYTDNSDLATKLTIFRDAQVVFSGGTAGWPPAEVFAYLREQGLTFGSCRQVMWRGPGDPVFSDH